MHRKKATQPIAARPGLFGNESQYQQQRSDCRKRNQPLFGGCLPAGRHWNLYRARSHEYEAAPIVRHLLRPRWRTFFLVRVRCRYPLLASSCELPSSRHRTLSLRVPHVPKKCMPRANQHQLKANDLPLGNRSRLCQNTHIVCGLTRTLTTAEPHSTRAKIAVTGQCDDRRSKSSTEQRRT